MRQALKSDLPPSSYLFITTALGDALWQHLFNFPGNLVMLTLGLPPHLGSGTNCVMDGSGKSVSSGPVSSLEQAFPQRAVFPLPMYCNLVWEPPPLGDLIWFLGA